MEQIPPHRRRRRIRGVMLAAILAVASAATALPAVAGSPEEERLAEARARVTAIKQEIEAASAQYESDKDALRKVEARVTEVLDAVGAAELAVERQQQRVEDARIKLTQLEATAAHQEEITADRLVELFKQGSELPLASVLASGSPQEALERSMLVEAVTRADTEGIEQLQAAHTAVDAQREQLTLEEATLERVLGQQEALLADVQELRDERAVVLAGSADRLADLDREERYLLADVERLAAIARRAAEDEAAARAAEPVATSTGSAVTSSAPSTSAPRPAPAPVSGGWT